MLYFIQATVTIRVFGVSGPFVETVTKLVNARSTSEAKFKYEQHVRQLFSNMNADTFEFQYLIVGDTI